MTALARERSQDRHGEPIPALRPGAAVRDALDEGDAITFQAGALVSVVRLAATGNCAFALGAEPEVEDAVHVLPAGVEYLRVLAGEQVLVVALEDGVEVSISEC